MSSDWGGEPVSLGVVRKPVAHPHSAVEPPDALTCPISLELSLCKCHVAAIILSIGAHYARRSHTLPSVPREHHSRLVELYVSSTTLYNTLQSTALQQFYSLQPLHLPSLA